MRDRNRIVSIYEENRQQSRGRARNPQQHKIAIAKYLVTWHLNKSFQDRTWQILYCKSANSCIIANRSRGQIVKILRIFACAKNVRNRHSGKFLKARSRLTWFTIGCLRYRSKLCLLRHRIPKYSMSQIWTFSASNYQYLVFFHNVVIFETELTRSFLCFSKGRSLFTAGRGGREGGLWFCHDKIYLIL